MLLPVNRPSERYLDYLVTVVPYPARQPSAIQKDLGGRIQRMILDCWDVSFSKEDFETCFLMSHWVAVAHTGGEVVGFVAGRHLRDIEVEGRLEDVAVIDAAVVDAPHRRVGIMSRLLSQGVLEAARGKNGTIPRFFKPVPLVMRTGSRAALTFGQRFLKGPVGPGFRPGPRHQALITAVARRLGWYLDEWNIDVSGARSFEDDDVRFRDLHDYESLVIAGDLTSSGWWKLQSLFLTRYPLRHRQAVRRERAIGNRLPGGVPDHFHPDQSIPETPVPGQRAEEDPSSMDLSAFVALSETLRKLDSSPGRAKSSEAPDPFVA